MATKRDSTAADDGLEWEAPSGGWRSALNLVTKHPFFVASMQIGDEGALYPWYFWNWDLDAAMERFEITKSEARSINKMTEEDDPETFEQLGVVLGVFEVTEEGELKNHALSTFHLDTATQAIVRRRAKTAPELIAFDIEEEEVDAVKKALQKKKGVEAAPVERKGRKKVSKRGQAAAGDDAAETDSEAVVPELVSADLDEGLSTLEAALKASIEQVEGDKKATPAKKVARKTTIKTADKVEKKAPVQRRPRKKVATKKAS